MDPDRLADLITNDAFANHLGLRLVPDPDHVVVEMQVEPRHLNFLGTAHGGAVFSLADCAMALASNGAGAQAVAIDTHLVLTAGAGPGDVLTARAEEATRGRTLGTYQVTVTRADGRVIGLFTGTVLLPGS